MRIGILGPIEVSDGNRAVPVVGQRQRALLATLTLELGRTVSVANLIDALWGTRPPTSARTKIQGYVSALRKAFGQELRDSGPLVTRAPGYLLLAENIELDLSVFESLTAQARAASESGRSMAASELFGSALALWRGAAFADIESPMIQSAAAKLEERRIRALESKAEADLSAGMFDSVIADAWPMLAIHPFRERLRATMMIALYHLGCRAEALALYLDGYRLMVAELGLEPGTQLREVHQRILMDDPELASSPFRNTPATPDR